MEIAAPSSCFLLLTFVVDATLELVFCARHLLISEENCQLMLGLELIQLSELIKGYLPTMSVAGVNGLSVDFDVILCAIIAWNKKEGRGGEKRI